MNPRLFILALAFLITACASHERRQVMDGQKRPTWVESTKISWAEGDQFFVRSQYSVRGDERLNGCYQLAMLDAKETLLREVAEDVRGQIDSAQQSISENAEIVLNQSRTSEFAGRVSGVRMLEQFHERYKVNGTERMDCYLLSSIKLADYERLRRAILYRVAEVDPELKKALNERQVQFFKESRE